MPGVRSVAVHQSDAVVDQINGVIMTPITLGRSRRARMLVDRMASCRLGWPRCVKFFRDIAPARRRGSRLRLLVFAPIAIEDSPSRLSASGKTTCPVSSQ